MADQAPGLLARALEDLHFHEGGNPMTHHEPYHGGPSADPPAPYDPDAAADERQERQRELEDEAEAYEKRADTLTQRALRLEEQANDLHEKARDCLAKAARAREELRK